MAAFRTALELGAGIECDVRLTADGKVVVFHDHDLRRMCASALTVEASSAAMLAGQQLFDSKEHIPELLELLDMVSGRVPLLIEVKCRGGNSAQVAHAVATLVQQYDGPVGVMSFEPSVGKWLARHAPAIRRGLVISERASLFDRWRSLRAAAPQFLAIDVAAIARPWAAKERGRRWVYSWTVRNPDLRRTAEIHADAPIWEGDGRPRS